jgi:hypothetical protein
MIGFISTWLHTPNYSCIQQYSAIVDLHHLQHTVEHELGFWVPTTALNTQTTRVLLNHTLQMLLHYSTHNVFTSQDDCSQLATHELPAAVSHRELTDNSSRTGFSLSYKSLIWHAGKRFNCCVTADAVTWPSLLRYPSVYSCSTRHGSARQGEKIALSTVANRGSVFRCDSSCMA